MANVAPLRVGRRADGTARKVGVTDCGERVETEVLFFRLRPRPRPLPPALSPDLIDVKVEGGCLPSTIGGRVAEIAWGYDHNQPHRSLRMNPTTQKPAVPIPWQSFEVGCWPSLSVAKRVATSQTGAPDWSTLSFTVATPIAGERSKPRVSRGLENCCASCGSGHAM